MTVLPAGMMDYVPCGALTNAVPYRVLGRAAGRLLYEEDLFGDEAIRPIAHPKVLCIYLQAADAAVLERLGLFVKSAMTAWDQEN